MDDLFTAGKKEKDKKLLVDIFQVYRDARKELMNSIIL